MGSENMKSSIQVGKAYKIEDLLEVLGSDVRLGHIVVAGIHKYHQDKRNLEDILLAATKGLGKKDKHPTIYVTVLNIIDPFEKYIRFDPFYNSIERDVLFAIEHSAHREIAVPMQGMIDEAKKFGLVEVDKIGSLMDLLAGLKIYFGRKGMSVGTISNEAYITFKKLPT